MIDEKDIVKLSQYFPKPRRLRGNVKVKLDLTYKTKVHLKDSAGFTTPKFAKKVDLASLKWEIGRSDIGKCKTTWVNLGGLRDVVKNEIIKETVYDYTTIIEKVLKLKRNYLIIFMTNILLIKNVISLRQKILQRD